MSTIPCNLFFKAYTGRWRKYPDSPIPTLTEARRIAWEQYGLWSCPFKIERADKRRKSP